MTPETSMLVSYQRTPIKRRLSVYPAGGCWAEPSIDDAARWMRWVYEHRGEAAELGSRARDHAIPLLSPEAAGKRMAERLEYLRNLRIERRRAA